MSATPERRSMRIEAALLGAILLAASGCQASTVYAGHTVNPVLFGPVKSLGGRSNARGEKVRSFVSESFGSATTVGMGAPVGRNTVATLVVAEKDASLGMQNDSDIMAATSGDTSRHVALSEVRCSTYFLYALVMFDERTRCEVSGDVFKAPASALPAVRERDTLPPGDASVGKVSALAAPGVSEPNTHAPAGASFDKAAARAALEAAATAAKACGGNGPGGDARVAVTFAPSGQVTSAQVETGPFVGTTTGDCIARALQSASVPPFEGSPVIVHKQVSLGEHW